VRSPFRPARLPDPAVLAAHRPLIASLQRRGLVRGAFSLGALAMLTGCNTDEPAVVDRVLRRFSALNDQVQAWMFDPDRLAPTYPASMVLKPPRFNAYYDITEHKPVDGARWRLELSGLITEKAPWTAAQLDELPQAEMIIRHICVEGWDYIGQWSGVTLRRFLERVGADTRAKYVNFFTADDYPSSIDMATALHPQTLLATRYAGETLASPFGYPLRLRMATKLGYKNPKWITAIEVTNTYMPGYWEQRGFNWFAGL
jgi:DMSO/TMAO reductase YedYZ molybdopterin-dependent catalytic subunit